MKITAIAVRAFSSTGISMNSAFTRSGCHAANSSPTLAPSEVPPTGLLMGMAGELSFYYGACWRHYRSAQR